MKIRHLIAMWFVGYASAMLNVGWGRDFARGAVFEIAVTALAILVIYAATTLSDTLSRQK